MPEILLSATSKTKEQIFATELDFCDFQFDALIRAASDRLRSYHCVAISNFPLQVDQFISFLSKFGEPLSNYAAGEKLPAYQLHPSINRVQYQDRATKDKRFHEMGGPLYAHSARSWSRVRPSYFAMLMINPGWTDNEPGQNGESIMVPWKDVLESLESDNALQFSRDFNLLKETPIQFYANHVQEEISDLPVLYLLPDTKGKLDLGARLKVDLIQKLRESGTPPSEDYLAALGRFRAAADLPSNRAVYQMQPGDLVLIDNNRFGHGRLSVIPTRQDSTGNLTLNSRELWSTSIGPISDKF